MADSTLPMPDDPDYGQDDQLHDNDFSDDIDESESPLAERYSKRLEARKATEEGQK
jgi:hypothetical protein